ncbi:MAG: hypothetical protein VYC19_12465 [Pseudomonadota bacterium]|jgi:hypothetical protein|nr:hypothetical protein [Pseudomonadota bacterium]MEC9236955.1 hypothetical protein [Pseudomonadota bacterium]MEE3322354.1 hypothetical protein [Pseudomonadota bacterium]
MQTNNAHRPTHWFFSLDQIIKHQEQEIQKLQKNTTSDVAQMANSMISMYEAELKWAKSLQLNGGEYVTVRARNYTTPSVDLINAIAQASYCISPSSVTNKLNRGNVHANGQLNPSGAYYDFTLLKEEINSELDTCISAGTNAECRFSKNMHKANIRLSQKFAEEVRILNNSGKDGVVVAFNDDMPHDSALKTTTQELVLRALT